MAAQWRKLAQQQAEIDIGVRLDMRPRPRPVSART